MTPAIRQETCFRSTAKRMPGCYRFQDFAYRNPTWRAAMRRIERHAVEQGRELHWVTL